MRWLFNANAAYFIADKGFTGHGLSNRSVVALATEQGTLGAGMRAAGKKQPSVPS